VGLLENPYEFLQFFHVGNFRVELIDNLLRHVRRGVWHCRAKSGLEFFEKIERSHN
jgi:hypothetical protein